MFRLGPSRQLSGLVSGQSSGLGPPASGSGLPPLSNRILRTPGQNGSFTGAPILEMCSSEVCPSRQSSGMVARWDGVLKKNHPLPVLWVGRPPVVGSAGLPPVLSGWSPGQFYQVGRPASFKGAGLRCSRHVCIDVRDDKSPTQTFLSLPCQKTTRLCSADLSSALPFRLENGSDPHKGLLLHSSRKFRSV